MNKILTQINKDMEEFEKDFRRTWGDLMAKKALKNTTTSHLHAMQATLEMVEGMIRPSLKWEEELYRAQDDGYNTALEAIATDIRETIEVLKKEV